MLTQFFLIHVFLATISRDLRRDSVMSVTFGRNVARLCSVSVHDILSGVFFVLSF